MPNYWRVLEDNSPPPPITRSGNYGEKAREAGLTSDRLKKDYKNQRARVAKAQRDAAAAASARPTPPTERTQASRRK